jgi:hypothetical protein
MSINGRFKGISRTDLAECAARFDIPSGGRVIVDRVLESLQGWPRYSADAGVPAQFRGYLQNRFERFTQKGGSADA